MRLLSFLSTSRRCSRNRSPSRLPVSPMYIFFAISTSYEIDDVGGGAREVISDLDGSLGSRYLVGVVNERTSFASCAGTFKSAGLVISFK